MLMIQTTIQTDTGGLRALFPFCMHLSAQFVDIVSNNNHRIFVFNKRLIVSNNNHIIFVFINYLMLAIKNLRKKLFNKLAIAIIENLCLINF